jgi:hypothetical protein
MGEGGGGVVTPTISVKPAHESKCEIPQPIKLFAPCPHPILLFAEPSPQPLLFAIFYFF